MTQWCLKAAHATYPTPKRLCLLVKWHICLERGPTCSVIDWLSFQTRQPHNGNVPRWSSPAGHAWSRRGFPRGRGRANGWFSLNIKPHKHQLIERVPQVFYGTTDASFSETVVAGLQKQDGNPQLQSGKWKTQHSDSNWTVCCSNRRQPDVCSHQPFIEL